MFNCLCCLRSEHLFYILSVFCCKSPVIYFIAVDPVCLTHMLAPLLQLSENFCLEDLEPKISQEVRKTVLYIKILNINFMKRTIVIIPASILCYKSVHRMESLPPSSSRVFQKSVSVWYFLESITLRPQRAHRATSEDFFRQSWTADKKLLFWVYSYLGTHKLKACWKRRKQAWPGIYVLLPMLVAKAMNKTLE